MTDEVTGGFGGITPTLADLEYHLRRIYAATPDAPGTSESVLEAVETLMFWAIAIEKKELSR